MIRPASVGLLILHVVLQHLRRFRAGGLPGGIEDAAALSVDNAVLCSPAQGFQCPVAGPVCVGKVQLPIRGGGASSVPPQHDGQLLPRDVVIGAELSVAIAPDNALGLRPGHPLGVPLAVVHVRKRAGQGLGRVALQVVEHHRQHTPAHGGVGAELAGGGAVEQLMAAGKGHGVRRPACGGNIGKIAAVVHDLQLGGTVQGDGHGAIIRHGLPHDLPCAVLMNQHGHGAGGGAGGGHGEGHAAWDILNGLAARRHGQLHAVPRLLGCDDDRAARASQAAQSTVGDGHVSHGGGNSQAGVGLAPDLAHGGGRDGNLRFGHVPGDAGGNHHIFALVCGGLPHNLLAHGRIDRGGRCTVADAGGRGGGGRGGCGGAALAGGGHGEAGAAGVGGHITASWVDGRGVGPQRNLARQGVVVGRVGGGKRPLILGISRHFCGVGQHPGHGARWLEGAALSGQSSVGQGLAAGRNCGVLGRARGGSLADGHNDDGGGLGVLHSAFVSMVIVAVCPLTAVNASSSVA